MKQVGLEVPLRLRELDSAENQRRLDECVHCGLCLLACPTYRVLRLEPESPRGRLHLMKAAAAGEVTATAAFAGHMNLCLQCRACETACPATVQFGHLMEITRAAMRHERPPALPERLVRRLVFAELLPHPGRLAAAGLMTRVYESSGLRRRLGASGLLGRLARWPGRVGHVATRLAEADALMPNVQTGPYWPGADVLPGFGQRRHRVAVLLGCIQNVAFADVNAATVRVLRRLGSDVLVPPGQTCCGALHAHAGERDLARDLARRNLTAFQACGALADGVGAILINAAGCGAAMKQYGELLADDPTFGPIAARFSARVRDVSEWIADHLGDAPLGALPIRVTYQDACHLAHGQNVRRQPRDVLRAIPALTLLELRDADRCCGSAGIYNLLHPEIAGELRREKVANVLATGADVVVSGNPGCLLQMRAGLRRADRPVEAVHLMTLLDRALAPSDERAGHPL